MAIEIPKRLEDLPTSSPRFVGRAVKRIEDPELLTGRTEFIDNVVLPGMLHCAILRSPLAHARIASIDVSAAEAMPGVIAVISGEDAARWSFVATTSPEGFGSYCLATDKVRFVGEPVAAVAASSRYLAEDALERIEVDYEPLEVVSDASKAADSGSPPLFEERGTNVMFQRVFTWGDVDAVFREADQIFTEEFRWNRLGANPIETFGVISEWNPVEGSLTCHGAYQSPSFAGLACSVGLGLPSNKVRIISQPHGGSFGGKGGARGTLITAMLSRKARGRPVKWIEDRMEYLVAGGSQAWDRHYRASLAVGQDGTVTGLKVELLDDLGAGGEGFGAISAAKPLAAFTGPYAIGVAQYDLTLVATNKLPASPFEAWDLRRTTSSWSR